MRIVIISQMGLQQRRLIRSVCDAFPNTVLIRPVGAGRPSAKRSAVRSSGRSLRRTIDRIVSRTRHRLLIRYLYPEGEVPALPEQIRIVRSQMNSEETEQRIRAMIPDVLLSFGAPILKPNIYAIPKRCSINVHLGIPPKYRGNHAVFWAMYHRDFDYVGASLHHIDRRVDAGNLICEAYPALTRRSGEIEARAGAIRLVSVAAVDFLKHLDRTGSFPPGKAQSADGRNFKRSERTYTISLLYLIRRALFLGRPTPRDARVVRYYP